MGAIEEPVAFESGSEVRARLLSLDGDVVPNREAPPTTADFLVAAGAASPAVAFGGPAGAEVGLVAYVEAGAVRARPFPP